MERKNPISLNESFICEHCKEKTPPASQTCRNHCSNCLYSKHVDQDLPGDRESTCNGMMEPIAIISSGKKGQQILHECQRCGERKVNKLADDDNRDMVIKVMQRQNIEPLENEQ